MLFNRTLGINSIIKLLKIENLNHVDKSLLDRQFRNLSKRYDPDYSETHVSERKLKKLEAAYEQALDNITAINDYLENKNGRYIEPQEEETKPAFRFATFVEDSEPYELWKCHWEDADSSGLDYVYYDSGKRRLFVLFLSNNKVAYCYLDIGPGEYRRLMNADSKSEYLRNHIIPNYECLKFRYYRDDLWMPNMIRTYDGIHVEIERRRLKGNRQEYRVGETEI